MTNLCLVLVLCLAIGVSATLDKIVFEPRGYHGGDKVIFNPGGTHVPPKGSPSPSIGIPVAPTRPPTSPIKMQPPAFFVFGDSLVDNGNNNFLITGARADMPPYGIDSPAHKPTGRFSNGLNIPDVIS